MSLNELTLLELLAMAILPLAIAYVRRLPSPAMSRLCRWMMLPVLGWYIALMMSIQETGEA